jgi:hypothetical protein
VKARAAWRKSGRKWTVNLGIDFWCSLPGISFAGLRKEDIRVSGASLTTTTLDPQILNLVLIPVRREKQAQLDVSMQCDKRIIPFRVTLDLSGPRKKNGVVPAELVK